MGRAGLLELRAARSRDRGIEPAGVVLARRPLDPSLANEAIHQPGQAASAEEQLVGELAHPRPPIRRVGEDHQDLVRGEGEGVLALELGIQAYDEIAMRAQHALPGRDLVLGQTVLALLRALHGMEG